MIGGPIGPFIAAFCVGLVSSVRELPSAGNFRCRILLLGQFSSSVSAEHIDTFASTISRIIKLVISVKYQELFLNSNLSISHLKHWLLLMALHFKTFFSGKYQNCQQCQSSLFQQCNKTNSRSFIFGHIALAFLTCCCNILFQKFIPCLEECDGTGIYLLFLQFRCFIVQLCAGIFMSPFHHCAI